MNYSKHFIFIATLLLGSSTLIAGCAVEVEDPAAGDDVKEATEQELKSGEKYKLYTAVGGPHDPSCDIHTALSVTKSSKKSGALILTLEDRVLGSCPSWLTPVSVSRNKRTFVVTRSPSADRCGSLAFTGIGGPVPATKSNRIAVKLMDNRLRRCEDQGSRVDLTLGSGASAERLFSSL